MASSAPKNWSAIASAVSVLPTPDGPHIKNTPIGLRMSVSPARDIFKALVMAFIAPLWPITRDANTVSRAIKRWPSSAAKLFMGTPDQSETTPATVCSVTQG